MQLRRWKLVRYNVATGTVLPEHMQIFRRRFWTQKAAREKARQINTALKAGHLPYAYDVERG